MLPHLKQMVDIIAHGLQVGIGEAERFEHIATLGSNNENSPIVAIYIYNLQIT